MGKIRYLFEDGRIKIEPIDDDYVSKGIKDELSIFIVPDDIFSNQINDFEKSLENVDQKFLQRFSTIQSKYQDLVKKGFNLNNFKKIHDEQKQLIQIMIDSISIPIEYSTVKRSLSSSDFLFQLLSTPENTFVFDSPTSIALFTHSIPILELIINNFNINDNQTSESRDDNTSEIVDSLMNTSNSNITNNPMIDPRNRLRLSRNFSNQIRNIREMGISNVPLIESALIQSNGDMQTALEIIFSMQDMNNDL